MFKVGDRVKRIKRFVNGFEPNVIYTVTKVEDDNLTLKEFPEYDLHWVEDYFELAYGSSCYLANDGKEAWL